MAQEGTGEEAWGAVCLCVCVSVKHLPPGHWRVSSGFQAEIEEERIRGDINYPTSNTSRRLAAEKAEHGFYWQALEGNPVRGLGAPTQCRGAESVKKGPQEVVFGGEPGGHAALHRHSGWGLETVAIMELFSSQVLGSVLVTVK